MWNIACYSSYKTFKRTEIALFLHKRADTGPMESLGKANDMILNECFIKNSWYSPF